MRKETLQRKGFGKTIKTVQHFSREGRSPRHVERGTSWAWPEYDVPESRPQGSHGVGEHRERANKNPGMSCQVNRFCSAGCDGTCAFSPSTRGQGRGGAGAGRGGAGAGQAGRPL